MSPNSSNLLTEYSGDCGSDCCSDMSLTSTSWLESIKLCCFPSCACVSFSVVGGDGDVGGGRSESRREEDGSKSKVGISDILVGFGL